MRHAHLDDSQIVLRLDFEQHQGKSEMIVEVAFGFQHAKSRRKHMGDGFFGRRFSRRSGDPDQRLPPQAPNCARQRLQAHQRVIDCYQARLGRDSELS